MGSQIRDCEAGLTGHVLKSMQTDVRCMCGLPIYFRQCVRCRLVKIDRDAHAHVRTPTEGDPKRRYWTNPAAPRGDHE